MKYGYARVSTVDQNVTQQAQKLIEQYSIEPENIIQEVWTGKTTERPALQKLINRMHGLDHPHWEAPFNNACRVS